MDELRKYTREDLRRLTFDGVFDYINELWDEIVELKRALKGYRNKLDEKEDYIGRLQMQITDMQEEIQKLRSDNVELHKKNDELESENYYFHRRIAILKEENQKLKETLNNPIGYLDLDLVDKAMKYGDFARHIRKKYEALTDAGFSHDDAMSLIPLWDDGDFEEFKEGN